MKPGGWHMCNVGIGLFVKSQLSLIGIDRILLNLFRNVKK